MVTKKEKTEKEILEEINNKMTKMLTILAIAGKEDDVKIQILKKAGFTSEETGLYVGLTNAAVRKRKSWSQK
jgi:hypothetical protein